MENINHWKPSKDWMQIKTIEMHTGGEPLRVYIDGLPDIKGNSILEKRRFFKENFDFIRTGTIFEPRGHADMYGAIITEPCTEDADFGTFFLHNEGYSTMCGHAIIALTKFALETGLVVKQEENAELIIDAPPGKIYAKGYRKNGIVDKTSFLNVPSFVLYLNEKVDVDGIGEVTFDVSYGGAFYAFVDAEKYNISLNEENYNQLIDFGRRIKKAVMKNFEIKHPFEKDLSFLYGTIFTGKAKDSKNHSRNVCIFADGEVDRSATGSGVSARAALHYEKKELKMGEIITIESILGTTMDVEVKEVTSYGNHNAVIPEVTGKAYFTGKNEFYFDPNDPLVKGFILR
jgi:proline racemase